MIRRLIILLLIAGCAHKPPQATFYLGMTEEEFIIDNEITLNTDGFYSKTERNNGILYQRWDEKYLSPIVEMGEVEFNIMYSEAKRYSLSPYYFIFENDSLIKVSKGIFNEKHIDYEKYATPPE